MEISTKMKIKLDFFREIINYFSLPNTGSMVLHEGVPHLVSTAARLFGRQPDVILGNPLRLVSSWYPNYNPQKTPAEARVRVLTKCEYYLFI